MTDMGHRRWVLAVCCAAACLSAPTRGFAQDRAADASACQPINQTLDSGPFSWPTMVFFGNNQASLSDQARAVLDGFARRAITSHATGIVLEPYVGGAEMLPLSLRRAAAVTRYLHGAGVRETPEVTLAGD